MNKITKPFIFLFLLSVAFSSIFACEGIKYTDITDTDKTKTANTPATTTFTLTSSSFTNTSGVINNQHLGPGRGSNLSPPLRWENPPTGTQFFYILMQDAQSPNWKHWLVKDLPDTTLSIPQGRTTGTTTENWTGYYGPTPPAGTGTHTYTITIYAVDKQIAIADSDNTAQAKTKLDGDNLGTASISGTASGTATP